MVHLTPALLVDLAEGIKAEHSVPHLARCDACRRALADLRATMVDVAGPRNPENGGSDVPEPSPLFWDHLSSRVREAVAEQDAHGRVRWFEAWPSPLVALPILTAAAAATVLAVVTLHKPTVPNPIPATPLPILQSALLPSLPPLEPLGAPDDPALALMSDYGTSLGWDDLREEMAGVSHAGGIDEAVVTLSTEERQELQRLLEEEMTQPSALGAS
jgi:hypothetical protein